MEPWQKAWREGIAPQLTNDQLLALGNALSCNDFRLIQGTVASPNVNGGEDDLPCRSACAIGFPFMVSLPGCTTEYVIGCFESVQTQAYKLTGFPNCVETFTHWFDNWPRKTAFPHLLAEIDRELNLRAIQHTFSTTPK